MLTPEEEAKLSNYYEILKAAKDAGVYPRMGAYDIEWLANKFKEINDELKAVTRERDGLQQQYTSNVYKNPNNEISDRFYPR